MRYAAERRSVDESIEELRQIADGRNDILAKPPASQPVRGVHHQQRVSDTNWSLPGC
jgi:hypothetical protein